MSTSKSEKLDRKNDEAKGDSKKSKSRSSDQHKRDSKVNIILCFIYSFHFRWEIKSYPSDQKMASSRVTYFTCSPLKLFRLIDFIEAGCSYELKKIIVFLLSHVRPGALSCLKQKCVDSGSCCFASFADLSSVWTFPDNFDTCAYAWSTVTFL